MKTQIWIVLSALMLGVALVLGVNVQAADAPDGIRLESG
jgi:hypothetical protein